MLSHHIFNKTEWTQFDDYSFNYEMAYCGSSELRDEARDRFLSFKNKDGSEISIYGRVNSRRLRLSFTTINIEKCENLNPRFMSGSSIKRSLIENENKTKMSYQFSINCDNDDKLFISMFFELIKVFHQLKGSFVTHILTTIQIEEKQIDSILRVLNLKPIAECLKRNVV